ncbi:hypothetical protein HMPREF9306_00202 [Propionimicrobium lymphophilum ACS-093-V-SCH5]|uniref:Uncharacterized protein n=1 Tax=Propionimicrobium lymphophilum ACS-093-V-SCH5 TaxID=883161 RepID=S2W1Z3_9ACTN|nr:hypothetical protein [Propionimicrobium lymphophilum]EPD33788.1 hypothetical protein HMPREF9306_00202 [Propionimicrobium lymphophilum ACS-093-V-SCH5]
MSKLITLRLTPAQAEALKRNVTRSVVDLTFYYDELSRKRRLGDVKRLSAILDKLEKGGE